MDTRGKIPALADRLYVSPYLLRPLRRLEEVEKEAARAKSDGKRSTPSASNDDRAPGRAPAGTEK